MPNFPKNPRRFSQTYTEREAEIFVPIEYKLMEQTGKNRKGVHMDAIRFYHNYRIQNNLQLI